MRFPFFRNRDSVKNGILISIRRTGDGFHPGLFIHQKYTLNNYLEENLHLIYFHDSNDIYTFQEDIVGCPFISPSLTSIPLSENAFSIELPDLLSTFFVFQNSLKNP